jgi:hypothetical protein
MNNLEQSYINGIEFALKAVNEKLNDLLTNPNTAQSLKGGKFEFLEPVRDLKLSVGLPSTSNDTILDSLKNRVIMYEKLCEEILQTTKAKKVRTRIISTLAKSEQI